MAKDDGEDFGSRASGGGSDPLAFAAALSQTGSLDPRVAAYLEKQGDFIDLQAEYMRRQDEYETSHLRWRRFNDQMRGAMQILVVVAGIFLVVLIATVLWDASEADGLVVDAFTVPPDLVEQGLGGDVIASDVTDKLATIRTTANANSFSNTSDVSSAGGDDIKVEIPETGVSLSEAGRALRRWLGNERHLTGSVRETADGKELMLSVSLDRSTVFSGTAKPVGLDALETRAATAAFAAFDPVNHIVYLSALHRYRDTYDAAAAYVVTARGTMQRADSYALWSYATASATGDLAMAEARAQTGIAIDPSLAVLHIQAMRFYRDLGRDEDVLHEARAILPLSNEDQPAAHRQGGFAEMRREAAGMVAYLTGDLANSAARYCYHACTEWDALLSEASLAARLHDPARADVLIVEAQAAGPVDPVLLAQARYDRDVAREDWENALNDAIRARQIWMQPDGDMSPRYVAVTTATLLTPAVAEAAAHSRTFEVAHSEADTTPAYCVDCERVHGVIDAAEQNWDGAEYWFARAVSDGPSMPYALTDWGRALLEKGDLIPAIEKFAEANRKAPRFADPLELWGEALITEYHSDLAVPKFAEAAATAPAWGRLHLKWGEALFYSGDADGAKAQFAIARGLFLTGNERAELAEMSAKARA